MQKLWVLFIVGGAEEGSYLPLRVGADVWGDLVGFCGFFFSLG